MSRPLPTKVSELKVPNLDFDYFRDHQARPFRGTTDAFCHITAWWLMECSLCSYIPDPRAIERRLLGAGFQNIAFCEANHLRAIAADLGRDTFVVFRGTLFSEMANVLTDLSVGRQKWHGGGRVHSGFLDAYESLLPELKLVLEARSGQRIWFTGHSLGGALATLFAAHFPVTAPCYTFGSPRVGDRAFRDAFAASTYRVVYGRDVVATMPPKPIYRHVAPSHRIHTNGKITYEGHSPHRPVQEILTEVRRNASQPKALARYFLTNNIIADHAPILYCIGLWNSVPPDSL